MFIEGKNLYFKDFDFINTNKAKLEEINILKQCQPIFDIFKEMNILFKYITISFLPEPINIYKPVVIKFNVSLNKCSIIYGIPINKEFDINELVKDVQKKLIEGALS